MGSSLNPVGEYPDDFRHLYLYKGSCRIEVMRIHVMIAFFVKKVKDMES